MLVIFHKIVLQMHLVELLINTVLMSLHVSNFFFLLFFPFFSCSFPPSSLFFHLVLSLLLLVLSFLPSCSFPLLSCSFPYPFENWEKKEQIYLARVLFFFFFPSLNKEKIKAIFFFPSLIFFSNFNLPLLQPLFFSFLSLLLSFFQHNISFFFSFFLTCKAGYDYFYKCICNEGYDTWNQIACIDRNECLSGIFLDFSFPFRFFSFRFLLFICSSFFSFVFFSFRSFYLFFSLIFLFFFSFFLLLFIQFL